MDEAPQYFPQSGGTPPPGPWTAPSQPGPAPTPGPAPGPRRRWHKAAAAAGIAAGTAMGAGVLAAAATSGSQAPSVSAGTDATGGSAGTGSSSGSGSPGSGTNTTPPMGPHDGPGWGMGGPGPGRGDVLHGVYTVQGPNGYETLQVQSGTVSAISDTSGSTWSMTVTSADGTALTYVIDSGTSVDGGETGVSSISKGDTVHVLAVVSSGTATAKSVADSTVMQSNGQNWRPAPPSAPSSSSGTTTS